MNLGEIWAKLTIIGVYGKTEEYRERALRLSNAINKYLKRKEEKLK